MTNSEIGAIAIAIGSLLAVTGLVCIINKSILPNPSEKANKLGKIGEIAWIIAALAFVVGIILRSDKAFEMIKTWLRG